MKAIVTGSNGFIGCNLCKRLKERGWQFMGIDDLSSGRRENELEGFRYEYMAVQDREKMIQLLKEYRPDTVFHLAAVPRVTYAVENPSETAEANVLGSLSVMEGVVKAGLVEKTRIVNTSSSAVYGEPEKLPTSEDHPCRPQSPYALQKYQAEEWGRLCAGLYGLNVVSLRYFNVFGPLSVFGGAYSTVLSAWLYKLYVDEDYDAFLEGDGKQTRDFCFVDNVVSANILAAEKEGRFDGEVFNVGQGEAHSLLECREVLEKIAGRSLPLVEKPPRVGDVKNTLADVRKARDVLGFHPDTDFEKQVAVMAAWYRDEYPSQD